MLLEPDIHYFFRLLSNLLGQGQSKILGNWLLGKRRYVVGSDGFGVGFQCALQYNLKGQSKIFGKWLFKKLFKSAMAKKDCRGMAVKETVKKVFRGRTAGVGVGYKDACWISWPWCWIIVGNEVGAGYFHYFCDGCPIC